MDAVLARLKKEVHAAFGPAQAPIAGFQHTLSAQLFPQRGQEVIKAAQVVQPVHFIDLSTAD
jgi:hypothetical protein